MGFNEHKAAVAASEGLRQADMALIALAGEAITTIIAGTPVNGSQLATKTANIAHFRRCLASANANGVQPVPYMTALRDLGTGGS